MAIKNFKTMIVLLLLLVNCEKGEIHNEFDMHDYRINDVLYARDGKLKYTYQVSIDDSRRLQAAYDYDNLGRISRKNYGSEVYAYDDYLYNAKGQLEKIVTYLLNLENPPILTHIVVYSYDDKGNKIKEQTEFVDEQRQTVYDLYQYKGEKLMKREHYEGKQQLYFKTYEYKDDKLIKEKFYVPGEKGYVTTEYCYDQGLLICSGHPKSGSVGERRYYDWNDNLIKTVVNMPLLSSAMPPTDLWVITEYEYE